MSMSILETPKAQDSGGTLLQLKLELKEWEKVFAAAHGGRKAGREDIKQNPDIANKYKQYNKLRAVPSKPATALKNKKRPSPTVVPHKQPSPKRPKFSQPPHPAILDPYDSPKSVHRTPTLQRTCIGPTPQKDGRVLGLFDLLSPDSRNENSPSKRASIGVADLNTLVTPCKALSTTEFRVNGDRSLSRQPSESPTSASKRAHREPFLTPSVKRTKDQRTPRSRSGVSKLRFDVTPSFLRRDSQGVRNMSQRPGTDGIERDGDAPWSPVAVRSRPRPMGRSLSTLVQGLRTLEDEKLDEEMDLMREMEQEGCVGQEPARSSVKNPTVAVEDSQVTDMPLGPDGAGNSENDSEEPRDEGKDTHGKPLKVWKKKGQKRTTRKSNMRPSTAKWKPEAKWKAADQTDEEDEPALVPETQIVGPVAPVDCDEGPEDNMEYLTEGDHDSNDDEDKLEPVAPKVGKPTGSGASNRKKDDVKDASKKKKKISPSAHANFRALKIKNKQSKGKGGGKFGRKRR